MVTNIIALLLCAMIQVESGGDRFAVGDGGLAVGAMQIQPIMVQDVNRILGHKEFTLDCRYDVDKSKRMALIYWNHYNKGDFSDIEKLARQWNGGPRGHRKQATVEYWEKVKKTLAKEEVRND